MIFLNQFYMSKICQIKKAGSQPLQLTTHSIPLLMNFPQIPYLSCHPTFSTSGHNVQKLSCDFSDIAYLIHHIIPLKAESVAVLDVSFNVKLILFVIIR